MQQGASCVHCKWCQPELCPVTHGVHLGQKLALYGQCISLGLFLRILRKEAFLACSSELMFWSPSKVLPSFFLSHYTYLKLSVFGNANMLQVWPRVLLKCWILKNQLEEEGLRAGGQKHSTAGTPAQVEPRRGAASLAPAGKNVRHVKTLHLSYCSINTPVTESHFQRPPLLLVLPGLLWKIFTEIRGNPRSWQRYGRVELHCCLSAFCKRANTNILGRLPCSHPALASSK